MGPRICPGLPELFAHFCLCLLEGYKMSQIWDNFNPQHLLSYDPPRFRPENEGWEEVYLPGDPKYEVYKTPIYRYNQVRVSLAQ